MKYFILNLFAVILCCFLTLEAVAQNKDGSTADANVVTSYDEVKKQTTVEFRMLGIANNKTERVVLSVSATFQGQKPEKLPEDVVFIISIASLKENRFPKVMIMEITADGKKLPEVTMLNANKNKLSDDDKRNNLETLVTRMRYDVFKQMMQAKSVKLSLPDLILDLDETRMAKMQELDKFLQP